MCFASYLFAVVLNCFCKFGLVQVVHTSIFRREHPSELGKIYRPLYICFLPSLQLNNNTILHWSGQRCLQDHVIIYGPRLKKLAHPCTTPSHHSLNRRCHETKLFVVVVVVVVVIAFLTNLLISPIVGSQKCIWILEK